MTTVAIAGQVSDLTSVDELIDWVVRAPTEEVCWRLTEIGSLSQWARAQKEATELRKRAVRLEFIALRKVALGGLAQRIPSGSQSRGAARWLASLTDQEFANVLAELDGSKSPISLYRADRAQRDALAQSLRRSNDESEHERRTSWDRLRSSDGHLRTAATTLLSEILKVGEPFTVSEAADRLADRLDLDLDVRQEAATGLREMVRSAIRQGEHAVESGYGILPVAFTYETADGIYIRVPAVRATFGHLIAHEREVRDRAEASLRQADALAEMIAGGYESLGISGDADDLDQDHRDRILAVPLSTVIDKRRDDGYTARQTSGYVEGHE